MLSVLTWLHLISAIQGKSHSGHLRNWSQILGLQLRHQLKIAIVECGPELEL